VLALFHAGEPLSNRQTVDIARSLELSHEDIGNGTGECCKEANADNHQYDCEHPASWGDRRQVSIANRRHSHDPPPRGVFAGFD
jgi:hypothetical protein